MKKEKIILQLGVEIDNLKAHIQRLKKDNYQLHPMDVELLQQKTRQFYDMLFELENVIEHKVEALPVMRKQESRAEKIGEVVSEHKSETTAPKLVETAKEETKVEDEDPEIPVVEEETIPPETPKAEEIAEEKKPEPEPKMTKPEPKTEPVSKTQKQTEVKSNFDLFSDSAPATVGDKFTAGDEQSLAEKMQYSRVTDLRQSIGINEKFLFINELFNGDLGRYNKAVDELNELTTLKGVQTYLMEIKIQHQWDEGMEAWQKLTDLVERKFK